MNTLFISSNSARILNVIDNKGSIVDDLAKSCDVENFFFLVSVKLSDEHTENRSPFFPSSIQQIIDGLGETLS